MKRVTRNRRSRDRRLSISVRSQPSRSKVKRGRQKIPRQIYGRPIIQVPEVLCLYSDEERDLTWEWLADVRDRLASRERIALSFSNSTQITAAALLRLHAIIQSANEETEELSALSLFFSQCNSYRFIRDTGFLKLTGGPHPVVKTRIYPISRYYGSPQSVKGLVENLVEIIGLNQTVEEHHALSIAVEESILNVFHHAYQVPEKGAWWFVAQRFGDTVYIAILDVGLGIPETLERTLGELLFRSYRTLYGSDDCYMIKAALEHGRSGTGLGGRGKGLSKMQDMVDTHSSGKLWIYSNRGYCVYSGASEELKTGQHRRSMRGTIVQWSIHIPPLGR